MNAIIKVKPIISLIYTQYLIVLYLVMSSVTYQTSITSDIKRSTLFSAVSSDNLT